MATQADNSDTRQFEVESTAAGQRLDKWLATKMSEYSRGRLQAWIEQGLVTVDGEQLAPKARLVPGSLVRVTEDIQPQQEHIEPQPIEFELVYQDEHLLIINKPAGLTVHPGAGQPDQTLQNGLLYAFPQLADVPRAGIVHRLDKDTSGLMMVAGSVPAHTQLVRDLQERAISREYCALVWGTPVAGATINAPLGRHPRERIRFAVREGGREAVTHYRVAEKFSGHARLILQLETGRTHQIRVHMQHAGYPLIGDPLYGRRGDPYRHTLGRQALHAQRLALRHPVSGEEMEFTASLPADMQGILDDWRAMD